MCVCAHARVYALRIVTMDKILCFINTLIISITFDDILTIILTSS